MGVAESKRRNTNILRGWWALTQRASTQGNKMENRKKNYIVFLLAAQYTDQLEFLYYWYYIF